MNNKKILYLATQAEFGGAQRYVFDLANNLNSSWQVSVATGLDGDNNLLIDKLSSQKIKHYTLKKLTRNICPGKDYMAVKELTKLIDETKPDIIHLNSSKISIIGSLAAKLAKHKPKVVYTAHGWVFNEPMSFAKKSLYVFLEKFTAKWKHQIICLNSKEYNQAKNLLNINPDKLSVIYHGPAPINFLSRASARQILNIPENIFAVGLIGNFYATKGLQYFIEAATIIRDANLPIKLIIIGEGALRSEIESQIKDNNLENIILTGAIDQAATLLLAFDTYTCSSVKEGFPYSILEAMSAGLPIVSTDVGGIPEMIADNETGLLVETKNSTKLAEAIMKLYNNEGLRNKIGQMAKKKVETDFTIEQMVKKTEDIYNK